MPSLTLLAVPGEFAVCRLSPTVPVPVWADSGVFSSVTRTPEELSVICPAAQVPPGIKHEAGWRLLKFQGPFNFGAVGVMASVTAPLAAARVSLLAVATFDTDYVLCKAGQLDTAFTALRAAGHQVRQ